VVAEKAARVGGAHTRERKELGARMGNFARGSTHSRGLAARGCLRVMACKVRRVNTAVNTRYNL